MIFRVQHDNSFLIHEVPAKESMAKLEGEYGTFSFNPEPVVYNNIWRALNIEFKACEKTTKNIVPDVSENFARLFLSQKAYDSLHNLLELCGEFLSVVYGDEKGFIFNPLKTAEELNAMDEKLTGYDEHGNLVHYGFFEEKLSATPLFKTKIDSYTRLFCTEAFKEAIEKSGLSGLVFNADIANPSGIAYGNVQ